MSKPPRYMEKPVPKRKLKPLRWSWHTARRLRYPDRDVAQRTLRRFYESADKHRASGEAQPREGERIYLPDDLHGALLTLLESVILPRARYEQWCAHGDDSCSSSSVGSALFSCGIHDDRDERVAKALMEIEPFPSKMEVDRYKISKVLSGAGDIWAACRRKEHLLSSR